MPENRRFDQIVTDRLVMRRWQDSDRDPFAALNGDPETMKYFPATIDRAASDAFVDRIEERFEQQGYGLWALELTATGEFIGYTGLNPLPDGVPGGGGMEVGWRLVKQRLAQRIRDRSRAGGARRRVRRGRAARCLVDDRCAQRAVPGRDAPHRDGGGGAIRAPAGSGR